MKAEAQPQVPMIKMADQTIYLTQYYTSCSIAREEKTCS